MAGRQKNSTGRTGQRYVSFRVKISAIISALILGSVAVSLVLVFRNVEHSYREGVQKNGAVVARLVTAYSLEPMVMGNYTGLSTILEELLSVNHDIATIEVLDSSGTRRVLVGLPRPVDAGDAKSASRGTNADELVVSEPVAGYGREWGTIRVAYSLAPANAALAASKRGVLIVGISAVLIGLVAALLLSKAILAPLQLLVGHAKRIARGDLNNPITVQSRDEVGVLAATMEGMRSGLRQFVGRVARKAIGLEGSLEICGLPSILGLLHTSKRTGALLVQLRNGQVGVIGFAEGEVVNASLRTLTGERAFGLLFASAAGNFKFGPELTTAQATIQKPWEQLILDTARNTSDPEVIRQAVPGSGFIAVAGWAPEAMDRLQPLLAPEESAVLSLADGNYDIAEIAERLTMDEAAVARTVFCLLSVGLVEAREDEFYPLEKPSSPEVAQFRPPSVSAASSHLVKWPRARASGEVIDLSERLRRNQERETAKTDS